MRKVEGMLNFHQIRPEVMSIMAPMKKSEFRQLEKIKLLSQRVHLERKVILRRKAMGIFPFTVTKMSYLKTRETK